MAATPGQRVYLIRLAHGDGVKNPMPLAEFVALVKKRRGVTYDASAVSRMENGTRKVTLEDIDVLAPLDPLKRGKMWLAGWDESQPRIPDGVTLTPVHRPEPATDAVRRPRKGRGGNG